MPLQRGHELMIEKSRPGRIGADLPRSDVPSVSDLPQHLLRDDLPLPELSQLEAVRHFTRLSQLNYAIDTTFFPLGSCTMKYNPRVHEEIARLAGFADLHPLTDDEDAQGAIRVLYDLQDYLAALAGLDAVSLTPAAGAQGELTGILVTRAYHESRGEGETRKRIVIPDSAHGTNPATAAMAGYTVTEVPSDADGDVDVAALAGLLGPDVAAFMLTLPNTLGIFESGILEIARLVHECGALLYLDGANMNALVGRVAPGSLGFDIMHFNLHKTFSTPHGGGGPGAGPVAVRADLAQFLPGPLANRAEGGNYYLIEPENSIGALSAFYGNFGVALRAYAYIRTLGAEGLHAISENAVINANYLRARLKDAYEVPYNRITMHEALITGRRQKRFGVKTLDIAKRLLDYGYYAPTVYFPLVVEEAMLIEPTESESKEAIDAFCDAMLAIAREAETDPELVRSAPHSTPVRRLDEATAARKPILHW
ncbi:MAG: aminotransferase class V-fold PLP-dependent enzyme [Dehalococcoidia bacterium]|nr:aminotransferase class V-fold PLP-dependent enzyme [Dehalococcoidia bacterium]